VASTLVLTDDLDGSAGAQTVTFGINGRTYQIDLSKKNRTAFEKVLQPYIEASRREPTRARAPRVAAARGRKPAAVAAAPSPTAIREWAAANGYEISARGRIPAAIVEAYASAQ
jgi:uncharacterized membrane protein